MDTSIIVVLRVLLQNFFLLLLFIIKLFHTPIIMHIIINKYDYQDREDTGGLDGKIMDNIIIY